jgi:hypothetical protein
VARAGTSASSPASVLLVADEEARRVGRIGRHPWLDRRGWIKDAPECGLLGVHLVGSASAERIARGHLDERAEHLRLTRQCFCETDFHQVWPRCLQSRLVGDKVHRVTLRDRV